MISRRRFTVAATALGAFVWRPAAGATLPAAQSLQAELAAALGQGKPLVVMASLDGCPFCRTVRDSHLAPLHAQMRQPVVQLDMGSQHAVRDFDGTPSTHQAMLHKWSVGIAPTVLFFGKGGREVAERLAGALIPDFYGAYLEERLRTAQRSL